MNEAVERALAVSLWRDLPRELVSPMFERGTLVKTTAGYTANSSETGGLIALVLDGLYRIFVHARSDRQVTIGYARQGDTIGLSVLLAGPSASRFQSLTEGSAWVVSHDVVREHVQRDARLAWAVACQTARRTLELVDELTEAAFGSVRQRVARHLLDLVVEGPENGALLAPISQQELANAVGTAREVVSRVLGAYRKEGIVRPTDRGVEVLDAAKLYESSQVTD